jgi:hypothetical protein
VTEIERFLAASDFTPVIGERLPPDLARYFDNIALGGVPPALIALLRELCERAVELPE